MTAQTAAKPKEAVRTLYNTCINQQHLELLDELVSPDYEGPDGARGPAGFRATVEALRRGFPDIEFTIEDVIAEGDRVAVRWRWVATHDGPFRGIQPTHKRITNTGMAMYQFRDGRIVRGWVETDRLGALQQLGVVPTAAGPTR